jgi:hypothetical protein
MLPLLLPLLLLLLLLLLDLKLLLLSLFLLLLSLLLLLPLPSWLSSRPSYVLCGRRGTAIGSSPLQETDRVVVVPFEGMMGRLLLLPLFRLGPEGSGRSDAGQI